MSRAFVKEPDGDSVVDEQPELPVSPHPNHVTRRGLALLKREQDDLLARRRVLKDAKKASAIGTANPDTMGVNLETAAVERRIRYVVKRIESAIVFNPEQADPDLVGFGATVELEDEESERHTFSLVGEDEADPAKGLISWISPLAQQLKDRETGDEVRWIRPKGNLTLEIISVCYEGTQQEE